MKPLNQQVILKRLSLDLAESRVDLVWLWRLRGNGRGLWNTNYGRLDRIGD